MQGTVSDVARRLSVCQSHHLSHKLPPARVACDSDYTNRRLLISCWGFHKQTGPDSLTSAARPSPVSAACAETRNRNLVLISFMTLFLILLTLHLHCFCM